MRKFGIVIISIFIFFLAGPVFLGLNVQRTIVSSPDNIKQVLIKINAYERLTNIKASDLIALVQPENRDTESEIPEEMIQKAIDSITPEIAQRLVEQSLTAFYKSSQGGDASFQIDLREVKQATLASQPQEVRTEFEKSVPDFYNVNMPAQSRSVYRTIFSGFMKFLGLGILILLSFLAILMGLKAKGKMAVLGTVSLMVAIPLLAIFYLSFLIPFNLIASSNNNAVSAEAYSVFRDFVKELWNIIAHNLKNQGLIALGVSVLAYIIAIIIPKQPTSTSAPISPAPAAAQPVSSAPPPAPTAK